MRRAVLVALLALWPALASAQFATIGPTPATSDNGDRLATTAWVNLFAAGSIPLQSGKIFIGSGGNLAIGQTPSGDCTLSLTGVITCTQAAGNFQVIGNLTVGGSIIDGNGILFTNIVAPATPAAGLTRGYVDSTTKTFSSKNDAGTVSNTVVASLAVANQFMTGISTAGVITRAQPAFTDISGRATAAQIPQGIARSVKGVTGNSTVDVADIQGTANQFLGVNSAGTALAFNTMSQDCTLATGVITCTKTNNVAFATIATSGSASDLGTGTLPVARLSMTPIVNSLGADVNITVANTYVDGPSVAQGTSGTWFASGTVALLDTTGNTNYFCKLWDGTTVINSAATTNPPAGNWISLSMSGFIVTPAANIRISCTNNSTTTSKIKFNVSGLSKDSTITAFRIN